MSADQYLSNILRREAVDTGPYSAVRAVQTTLAPMIKAWASQYLVGVSPSGSFAKGTANRSGTDIDLFVSVADTTPNTLKEIYETLFVACSSAGYAPKRQNVSINIRVGMYDVDLVPAKKQNALTAEHSLYRRRADTWTKTNVQTHIAHIIAGRRISETRVVKLWRNQKGLDFPSFYLEMSVIAALSTGATANVSQNVWKVFEYLRDRFENARVVDPANTNNILSDDLTAAEKTAIKRAAERALAAPDWSQIVV